MPLEAPYKSHPRPFLKAPGFRADALSVNTAKSVENGAFRYRPGIPPYRATDGPVTLRLQRNARAGAR